MPTGEGRRCALMDMHLLTDSRGFWRCDVCQVTVNEHTHEALDRDGRSVDWPRTSEAR